MGRGRERWRNQGMGLKMQITKYQKVEDMAEMDWGFLSMSGWDCHFYPQWSEKTTFCKRPVYREWPRESWGLLAPWFPEGGIHAAWSQPQTPAGSMSSTVQNVCPSFEPCDRLWGQNVISILQMGKGDSQDSSLLPRVIRLTRGSQNLIHVPLHTSVQEDMS